MASTQFLDCLIKEYLIYRGFTATLRAFESELRTEKEKGFRVDRLVDQINSYINNHDLAGLMDLWRHLDTKIFTRLEANRITAVKKLENSLLKLYAITCVTTRQPDKLKEFFEKMTPDLQGQSEWKDWFALPFVKDPAENQTFSLYFSRQWQDTLMLSLHNFLALVFQALPPPRLADFKKTAARNQAMRDEIKQLKLRLAGQGLDTNLTAGNTSTMEVPHRREIMDDFYLIAQETAVVDNQVKSLKNFLRNITGGASKSPSSATTSSSHSETLKSRSSSRSRLTTTATITESGDASCGGGGAPSLSVSKQPLKRVTQSVNPQHLAVTATSEPVEDEVPSVVVDGAATSCTQYLPLGLVTYKEHRASINLLSISSVGARIASCDTGGVIKVWNSMASSPTTFATYISGSPVSSIAWLEGSERYLFYGTTSGQVRVCDVQEKVSIADCADFHPDCINILTSLPSGSSIFCCCGKRLLLLDPKTCKPERTIRTTEEELSVALFNHNGSLIIHGDKAGKLGVTALHTGELLSVWSAHSSSVVQLRLVHDETSVWSLSRLWQGRLDVHNPTASQPSKNISFCLLPDGVHCLISGPGRSAAIHRLPLKEETSLVLVMSLDGEYDEDTVAEWTGGERDCGYVFIGSRDGKIRIYTVLCQ